MADNCLKLNGRGYPLSPSHHAGNIRTTGGSLQVKRWSCKTGN